MKTITDETVLDCGHKPSLHGKHTTGYGTVDGKTLCWECYAENGWECCAESDRQLMREKGRIALYLTHNKTLPNPVYEVTNWPGTLRFQVRHMRKGRHNMAGCRYDVWFGALGAQWHGVQFGDNTQICHCKRIKA